MKQILTVSGKPLSDFSTFYDGSEWWRVPQKDVQFITIPGRSGDLTIDGNRFMNISIPFNCYIHKDFGRNFSDLVNYLSSLTGYQRIESNEEPDVFRMGQIVADIQPNMGQFNRRGTFTVEINFEPQKWLKSGEMPIEVNNSITLHNPTMKKALPKLFVTGTGTVRINNSTITVNQNTGVLVIDCESGNAYEGTINRNNDVEYSNNEIPVLNPGDNGIDFTGVTSLSVVPRWWKI